MKKKKKGGEGGNGDYKTATNKQCYLKVVDDVVEDGRR